VSTTHSALSLGRHTVQYSTVTMPRHTWKRSRELFELQHALDGLVDSPHWEGFPARHQVLQGLVDLLVATGEDEDVHPPHGHFRQELHG